MSRRFVARQRSIRFFNGLLYASGVVFNVFALASVISLLTKSASGPAASTLARVELEDARRCTKHMGGREFKRGGEQDVAIVLGNGREYPVKLSSHSTYGRTKDGHSLEMVDVAYTKESGGSGLLFFVVNQAGNIQSCVSPYTYPINRSHQLDCLAAAGEYQQNGECHMPVNLPSDCQMMNGVLNQKTCVVPAGNRILRASTSAQARRTCEKPDCES